MRKTVKVARICPRERVAFDPLRLESIRRRMGDRAERAVGEALEELALRLSQAARAHHHGRFDRLVLACREAADIGGELGLDRLGRVARTTATLAGGDDAVALAANLERLIRLGEAAVLSDCEMPGAGATPRG